MNYEEAHSLENTKQSQYSPCIIKDNETIARILFAPKHYDNGEILPAAFEQVFSKNGMSVLRLEYYFSESLSKTIEQLETDEVTYIGYSAAKVADIRAIQLEGYSVFYLLDTATKDKIGHADIFTIRLSIDECGLPKKAFKNYIRKRISEVFCALIIPEQDKYFQI